VAEVTTDVTKDGPKVRCCIAGGGPAGMIAGFLLARAGVEVTVLEKHGDFLRDFRGDTLHPSTLEVMHELGLLDELLRRPHDEAASLAAYFGDERIPVADFSHLPTRCKFIAIMPQWDFLDFIAGHARRLPTFALRMNTEVTDLITEGGAVTGVRARGPEGPVDIRADLVIAADGRHSTVRERAGLTVRDFGVPIDVLWLRVSRRKDDPALPLGRVSPGHLVVTIDRGDYWQCAFIIRKGAFAATRDRGIEAFRAEFAAAIPFLADRTSEIGSWDAVKLLTVSVDRLEEWARPGLLCIGDCAHAMSPVGGVGINLAIQDAVAAANLLAGPLRQGHVDVALLRRLQKRRWLPTVITQGAQVIIHRHGLEPILAATGPLKVPLALRLLQRFPYLRRIPARAVGIGLLPEHVHTPTVSG
jgi:2-polyprenyl-6-methoxyphenol hydroxylase-like FAD-dependent oxidoreductase